MNSTLIKRLLTVSSFLTLLGAGMYALVHMRAAIIFTCASLWAIGNIWIWAHLVRALLSPGPRRPTALVKWITIKLGFLVVGFGLLVAGAPYSKLELVALVLGVSAVLLSATALAFWGLFTRGEDSGQAVVKSVGAKLGITLLLCTNLVLGVASGYGSQALPTLPGATFSYSRPEHVPQASMGKADSLALLVAEGHPSDLASERATDGAHGVTPHEDVNAAHGSEHKPATPSLPNLITILLDMKIGEVAVADTPIGQFLHTYEYQIFLVFITLFLCVLILATRGLRALLPGPVQAAEELIVEGFLNFTATILGSREQARKHFPFIGSLFIFIWANNMFGIVPLFTGATSVFWTTAPLALCVFFYVHYFGIREGGFKHWLLHLMGNPDSAVGWALAPFLFVLELIGELAKPLSLSLRLYGNMTGEHILSGVFLVLGITFMGYVWDHPWVGLPLHLPFLFLSLLVGTIQALVFTLLATIYLALLLPHEEHRVHDERAQHAAHAEVHG